MGNLRGRIPPCWVAELACCGPAPYCGAPNAGVTLPIICLLPVRSALPPPCCSLQVDDLREENELLHRAVQTLQTAVDQSADPATSAHCQAVLANAISPQKQRQRLSRLVLPAEGAGAAAEAAQLALSSSTSRGKPPLQSHFSVNADSSSRGVRRQGSAAAASGGGNAVGEDSDGDTISLMSLNDGDSFTTDGQSLGAGGSTPTAASFTVSTDLCLVCAC